MGRMEVSDERKAYYMKYGIETKFKARSSNQNLSVEGSFLLSGKKSQYESSVLSAYADDKNGFLILHNQRKIFWGPGGKNAMGKDNFNMISTFQDSLVKSSSISSCNNVKYNSKLYKEITLSTNNNVKKRFHVNNIKILYDVENEMIQSVTCHYDEKSEMDIMKVTYYVMDFNYSGVIFSNAYSKIFNSNGKLKPSFKGYELIDNRSQN